MLHAVGEAGECLHGLQYVWRCKTTCCGCSIGHAGVLPVVAATQCGQFAQIKLGHGFAFAHVAQNSVGCADAVLQIADYGDATQVSAVVQPVRDGFTPRVVHADEGGLTVALFCEHAGFYAGVMMHVAMAIKMIRGQIGENANVGCETRHQVNLERREFEHVMQFARGFAQVEDGVADVTAYVHVKSAVFQHMADESRCGGLAVGAGDGDDFGTRVLHLPGEDFGIADDCNTSGFCLHHSPMRFRMGEWNPGAEDERIQGFEIDGVKIGDRHTIGAGLVLGWL